MTVQEIVIHVHGFAAGSPRDRGPTLALILAWAGLAAIGTAIALRVRPRRLALGVVLSGLIVVQLGGLTRSVVISSDLYRYAWDGRVQTAGVDPYRYTPLDPALTGQRDGWLFPTPAGCRALQERPGCTRINYKDAHTIYPPVAEAEFTLVDVLPGPQHEHRQQLAADVAALAACLLLIQLLQRAGRNPAWVTLFAWFPLVGLDLASDAHVDGLAVVLSLAALLAWQPALPRPPGRKQAVIAGLLIGAAVAVKLYPALLLVPMLRRSGVPRQRRLVAGCAAGLVLVSYLPHLAAVGTHVIGFLPDYLRVEGYQQGSRFLLLGRLGLSGTLTKLLAAVVLVAVTTAVLRSDPDRLPAPRASLYLVGTAFLVATPDQPWYGLLLVALAAAASRPEWSLVALAAYPLYFAGHAHQKLIVGSLSYGLAFAVVITVAVMRERLTPIRVTPWLTDALRFNGRHGAPTDRGERCNRPGMAASARSGGRPDAGHRVERQHAAARPSPDGKRRRGRGRRPGRLAGRARSHGSL